MRFLTTARSRKNKSVLYFIRNKKILMSFRTFIFRAGAVAFAAVLIFSAVGGPDYFLRPTAQPTQPAVSIPTPFLAGFTPAPAAPDLNPGSGSAADHFNKAEEYSKAGNYQQAIDEYTQAIESFPAFAQALSKPGQGLS
ncbi:MAG: tetratricopeptide repeat protein [Chloroflexota bacterium]